MKLITLLLASLMFSMSSAQEKCGVVVYDVINYRPVDKAVVMALHPETQKMYSFDKTNGLGRATFEFGESVDSFKLWVLHPRFVNYKSQPKTCINKRVKDTVFVYPANRVLKTVIIKEKRAVTIKGDTIRYVADSFKLPAGASVEDLLKNLPGLEVDENGAIKAQGKEVTKVLVDGDDFFGNDMTIATKNLDANMIDKVEVIDAENKKSQTTGISDGEKEKIINLKLKKEFKRGYFGKLEAGATNTERNDLFGMANVFSEYNKLSVYAKTNNMNSGISWEDQRELGISNNWYYDENLDQWTNGAINNRIEDLNVIPREIQSGVFYKRKFLDENGAMTLNFSQNRKDFDGVQRSTQTLVFDSSSRSSVNNKSVKSITDDYSTKLGFERRLDSFNKINLEFSNNIFGANGALSNNSDISIDSTLVNKNERINTYNQDKLAFNLSADWEKKFRKKGRFLGVNTSLNTSELSINTLNDMTGEIYSNNITIPQTLNQKIIQNSSNNNLRLSATFIEPIKKKTFTIESTLSALYNFNTSQQNTFERDNMGEYSIYKTALSNNYDYDVLALSQKVKLGYNTKKWNFSIGGSLQESSMFQKNLDSGKVDVNRSFIYFLPNAEVRWKYKRNSNANLSFNTFVTPPDINRLQPVTNNLNPQYITIGNPNLIPSYIYRLKFSNHFWYAISKKSLWMNINFRLKRNDFVNDVTQDENGVITNRYAQINGNYNLTNNISYSFPFKPLDVKLSMGAYYRFDKSAQIFNSNKFDVYNHQVYPNFSIRKNIDSVMRWRLSFNPSYVTSSSENPTFNNNNQLRSNISSDLTFYLPHKFEFTTNGGWNYIPANETFDSDQSFILLSASLKRNFLKGNRLTTELKMYDILGQNRSLNRSFFNNSITETYSDVLTRYVMLNIVWKFKNKTKNNEDSL